MKVTKEMNKLTSDAKETNIEITQEINKDNSRHSHNYSKLQRKLQKNGPYLYLNTKIKIKQRSGDASVIVRLIFQGS